MALQLRPLDAADGCGALKLGDPTLAPLKSFLSKQSKRLHAANLARTFVLVEDGETVVRGYVTVLCTHVRVQDFAVAPDVGGDFPYKDYPALKIGRLAVDSRYQGRGAGAGLVDFVIGLTFDSIMPHVGCRFLVLDAKSNSIAFYEKKGFSKMGSVLDGDASFTAMFIDLHRLNR